MANHTTAERERLTLANTVAKLTAREKKAAQDVASHRTMVKADEAELADVRVELEKAVRELHGNIGLPVAPYFADQCKLPE